MLNRFLNAVGIGHIYRKTRTGKEINQHQYSVSKRNDVLEVMVIIWPFISNVKRLQMRDALQELGV